MDKITQVRRDEKRHRAEKQAELARRAIQIELDISNGAYGKADTIGNAERIIVEGARLLAALKTLETLRDTEE